MIKGIDSQIMVSRTSDFARDSSVQQKWSEQTQNYIAAHQKAEAEHNQERIAKTPESEASKLHTEEDRKSGGEGGKKNSSSGEKKQGKDETGPGLFVPAGDNIIDIKV